MGRVLPIRTHNLGTWRTPQAIYDHLNAEFRFDFDPCPSWKIEFDGLAVSWGKSNFVNPPYKNIYQWLLKAAREAEKGMLSVFLIPSRTGSAWFHEIVLPLASEIRFIRGRLRFNGSNINAPFDSMIVVFGGSEVVRIKKPTE